MKSQDSLPIIFQVPRGEEEIPWDWCCCGRPASCCGVPSHGFFRAPRTRTSRHAHCRELLSVPRDLRQIHGRAPVGAPSFSDLSNLSAGGLRGRTTLAAPCGSLTAGTRGVGADASDGLAFTSKCHTPKTPGPARPAVLGPAKSRCPRAWQDGR